MGSNVIPPLPEGFTADDNANLPDLPEGFTPDDTLNASGELPPFPEGFQLTQPKGKIQRAADAVGKQDAEEAGEWYGLPVNVLRKGLEVPLAGAAGLVQGGDDVRQTGQVLADMAQGEDTLELQDEVR